MSIQAMMRVMEESEALATDRLVLLVMANRSGGDHDECYASVDRLAFECRLAPRTIQYAIRRLVVAGDLGEVGVHPEYRTNIYRVMPGVQQMHPPAREGSPDAPKQELTTTEPKTKNLKARAARSVTRPTDRQVYLAQKINTAWGKAEVGGGRITIPALQKLNTRYGIDAVASALGLLESFPPAEAVQSAYAYVEEICKQGVAS